MSNSINTPKKKRILYICLILFACFFPTSFGGIIAKSMSYIYLYYGLCLALTFWYVCRLNVNPKEIISVTAVIIYMVIASKISENVLGGKIVIARIIYVLLPIIVFSSLTIKTVTYKFAVRVNEILTLIIIGWNICIMAQIPAVCNFTTNYFSQFNSFTTSVFVESGKPVFTFGIYSYGAFFYALMFIFWLKLAEYNHNKKLIQKKYYAYAVIFIVFQFLMRGSTSLMLGMVMLIAFLRKVGTNQWRYILVPLFVGAGAYFIHIQDYDWNRMIVGTSTNGFASRYLSSWFANNFFAVKETVMGIGFTVPESLQLIYSDSGYILLFTMGSLFLPVYLYINLYRSLKRNLEKDVFIYTLAVFMLFEIALPGILYPKEIIYTMFFFMSMRAISGESVRKGKGWQYS